ncbi:MAG: DUF5688 family protein [Clostridiales bacterium]|nr:DUF5688 family protein [Clostridiales bacterium]
MREEQTISYKEFVENFKSEISRFLEDWDAKISIDPAVDEESEDYIVVKWSVKNGSNQQRFHMKEIFGDYESGKYDMDEIIKMAENLLRCCKEAGEKCHLDQIEDYNEISSRLIVRPVNYDSMQEKLKDGIYERVGDIALVLYIDLGTIQNAYTSCMVPASVLSSWKKCREEVMETALKNTYEMFPPTLFDIMGLTSGEEDRFCSFMDRELLPVSGDSVCGIFITNSNQINGAVTLFLPGVAKKLSELLGGDFYIAFTSMHEAAIHKINTVQVEMIRESLTELHRDMVESDDFLTERVYRYDSEKDRIELVED